MKFSDLPANEQKPIIDKFNSIKGILKESDSESAKLYVDWMLKQLVDSSNNIKEHVLNQKIKELRKDSQHNHYYEIQNLLIRRNKVRAPNYAYERDNNFVKGDIVHVSFGVGYCDEISDGHYGIILANIVGTMYLIAPLSSRKPRGVLEARNAITYFTGLNLPSKNGKDISYVEYNQIRFVHFRRLEYFGERQKAHISEKEVDSILSTFNNIL